MLRVEFYAQNFFDVFGLGMMAYEEIQLRLEDREHFLFLFWLPSDISLNKLSPRRNGNYKSLIFLLWKMLEPTENENQSSFDPRKRTQHQNTGTKHVT